MIENQTSVEPSAASAAVVPQPTTTGEEAGATPACRTASTRAQVAASMAVVLGLGLAYAPNLADLWHRWSDDPNYSHGFLVLPVALLILWQRLAGSGSVELRPWMWGWLALALVLGGRALFYEWGVEWRETATLPIALGCLTLTLGGWPLLRRIWPAIAFLGFMLPLPPQLNGILAQPLQHVATTGTCALLKLTGLWVVPEGNIIFVDEDPLEVAEACNGLSMLMSLAATVAAITVLLPMAAWKRFALLASIIPIALASNILRITATAWAYQLLGAKTGAHYAHDLAGWLMMPMALLLVCLEVTTLSWLIVKDRSADLGPREISSLRTSQILQPATGAN